MVYEVPAKFAAFRGYNYFLRMRNMMMESSKSRVKETPMMTGL